MTAPGMARFGGPGYWHAVEVRLGVPVILDCGGDAGLVLAALRAGCRDLAFTGESEVAARLTSIAGQLGGSLRAGPMQPDRVLQPHDDPADCLRPLLRGQG